MVIAFYRLAYASAMLVPFAAFRWRRTIAIVWRDLATQTVTGLVLAIHFGCWIASLAPRSSFATSVAASTVIVTMHPVLVALATPIVLRDRVPRGAWLGIAIALSGGASVALADARTGIHRVTGDLLAFGGAIAAAIYFLVGRRLRTRLSLLEYVTPVYVSAAIFLGIACTLARQPLLRLPMREHALFVALAVGPMILGHTVLNWSLRYVPAWAVSTAIVAEPVFSSALVFLVLGEAPPMAAVCGGVVVLVGVAVATRRSMPIRDQARFARASITARTPSTSDSGGDEMGIGSSR